MTRTNTTAMSRKRLYVKTNVMKKTKVTTWREYDTFVINWTRTGRRLIMKLDCLVGRE